MVIEQGAPARPSLPADFTADGFLAPGDYPLTLDELAGSMLVTGPASHSATWDAGWRAELVEKLRVLAEQLWQVGVTELFIDGSFVENKDHPNDIDGYFVCDLKRLASGELERELYPHFGQLCGITDKYGNELEFPSAFRLSRRDGKPRGIVQLIRGAP